MLKRFTITIQHALVRLHSRLAAWLLGPAARAGRIVADKDASLIGLRPGFPLRHSWYAPPHAPFFNHVGAITC